MNLGGGVKILGSYSILMNECNWASFIYM